MVARSFADGATPDGLPIVPFAAGLITLIPAMALTGLLWTLWRSDHLNLPQDDRLDVSAEEAGPDLLLLTD
jgi:hypothetical protein